MKLWWLGLVLLVAGLVFVPTSYFAIILNEYPHWLNLALFASWVLGVVAVPVGFLILLYCALRRDTNAPDHEPEGQSVALSGLYLVLAGLLIVPPCYFAVTVMDLSPAADSVLFVLGVLSWLAVPVGLWRFVTAARHRSMSRQAAGPRSEVAPAAGATSDLVAMLDGLRSAGLLTDSEYDAKRSLM